MNLNIRYVNNKKPYSATNYMGDVYWFSYSKLSFIFVPLYVVSYLISGKSVSL